MTLLSEKIGQDPARRCDAKCYNAHHAKCNCICGGRNHGAGLQKALDNVRDIFLPIVIGDCEGDDFIRIPPRIRELAGMKGRDRDQATQGRLFRRPLPEQKELFA